MNNLLTFAVIIGVSHYEDPSLDDLQGAENDAIRFAQSLINWGISTKQIRLHVGKRATYQAIVESLEEIRSFSFPFKLVFFYSGHGFRLNTTSPQSFLLASDSRLESDQQNFKHAFPLDRLIAILGEMHTVASYLFLDACALRINALSHPISLRKVAFDRKSFFCLLSSGLGESYESVEQNNGYFTKIVLEALAELKRPTVTEFVEQIRKKAASLDLCQPEMYNIETQYIAFLETKAPSHDWQCEDFQDHLIKTELFPLGFCSSSGAGKTTFAKEMVSQNIGCVHIPLPDTLEILEARLIKEFDLKEKEGNLFDQIENKSPWIILFLDNFSLTANYSKELLKQLEKRHLRVVLIETSPNSQLRSQWSLPPMDEKQLTELLHAHFPSYPLDHVKIIVETARGNPKRLLEIARFFPQFLTQAESNEELIGILQPIKASCGFIDLQRFCKTFQLSPAALKSLIENGLLFRKGRKWNIHAGVWSELTIESSRIDRKKALSYWVSEAKKNPYYFEPNHPLIELSMEFGIQRELEPFFFHYLNQLHREQPSHSHSLSKLAELFLKTHYTNEMGLLLAEQLLKETDGAEKAERLASLHLTKPKTRAKAQLIKAFALRRMGKWTKAVKSIQTISKMRRAGSRDLVLLFEFGCSLFASGKLKEAKMSFTYLASTHATGRIGGLSRCMLGTAQGWMGHLKEAEMLLREGIELLEESENPSEAWLGYNNLAEIYLLNDQREMGKVTGDTAYRLAKTREHFLESNRLRLEWDIWEQRIIDENIAQFECEDLKGIDPFLKASIHNTLTICHLAREDVQKAKTHLYEALLVTSSNGLPILISLTLDGLIRRRQGDENGSSRCLSTARSLANEQGNELALRYLDHLISTLENRERQMIW